MTELQLVKGPPWLASRRADMRCINLIWATQLPTRTALSTKRELARLLPLHGAWLGDGWGRNERSLSQRGTLVGLRSCVDLTSVPNHVYSNCTGVFVADELTRQVCGALLLLEGRMIIICCRCRSRCPRPGSVLGPQSRPVLETLILGCVLGGLWISAADR